MRSDLDEGGPKGVIYFVTFVKNGISWLYASVAYVLLLIIIVLMDATLLNSVYLILILVASALHFWNETLGKQTGYKLTRQIWILMVLYGGILVFALYAFQFSEIRILNTFVQVFSYPAILLNNIDVIGFEQFKDDDRWLSFLPYFSLLFLSVISSRQVHNVQREDESEDSGIFQISTQKAVTMDTAFFLRKLYLAP